MEKPVTRPRRSERAPRDSADGAPSKKQPIEKKLLAVIGNPVLHSKSPQMFNAVFEKMEIPAAYFRFAAVNAIEAVWLFKNIGLIGMNVTSPFKEAIIPYLDAVNSEASHIGGVNTVVKDGTLLKGYNTDYLGVINALAEQNIFPSGKRCVVVGAGGAGKAAAYGLIKESAEVVIVNRTLEKAQKIARKFGCEYERIENLRNLVKSADIVLSTLPADVPLIEKKWLKKKQVVFDANYKSSSLISMAEERECTIIKGENWLFHQAIPAFRYFFNTNPDKKVMWSALQNAKLKPKDQISVIGFAITKKHRANISGLGKSETYFKREVDLDPEMADLFIHTQNKSFEQIRRKLDEEISKTYGD